MFPNNVIRCFGILTISIGKFFIDSVKLFLKHAIGKSTLLKSYDRTLFGQCQTENNELGKYFTIVCCGK